MRFFAIAAMGLFSLGAFAQTTFNVDMACAPEGFTDVFVTGPWCGWCANDVYNTMTDDDGDGVYTVTLDSTVTGLIEYKYAINGFDDQENLINDMVDGATCAPVTDFSGYANRTIEAMTTANDFYGSCDGTCNDAAPADQVDVTFQVDMNDYTGTYGSVNLNGSFNGWCGACAAMTDADADGVFDLTISLDPGTYEYKFTLDGWTAQEEFTDGDACTSTIDGYVNRTVDITAAATLPVVCYNSCDACDGTNTGGGGGGETTTTTFNVDMSCATAAGATVNGATEVTEVFVTGPWCGWCAADGYNVLTDADGDGIFSVEIADLTGTVEYKYGINGFADQEQLVDDMVDGGACAPVTDFAGYANRQAEAGSTTNDVFGSCTACDDNDGGNGGNNGGGSDSTLVGLINLTFDEAASASAWEAIADATLPEASLSWNDTGVETGALEFGGTNTSDGVGRAYIYQYVDGNVDYQGANSVTLTFDAKLASPLSGAALHLQTEFPGVGTTNTFDIQGQGLNEASWTSYSYTFDNVSGDGIFRIQFNVASGAFVGAGGMVLLDNVSLEGNGGDGGGTETGGPTTFQVDMACATATGSMTNGTTEITEVFVTGPWCGWCGSEGYNVLTDADGDGIFSVEIADLTGDVEYKYAVNGFADQEQLVDDMVAGGTCAPVTDFAGFANRQTPAGSTTNDVYGQCGPCEASPGSGCTDPAYLEFDPYAITDDGSCGTLVVYGCPYEAATNYNPLANVDDLTCDFDLSGPNDCAADLDGDGSVTTTDLLSFLASFGLTCL